MEYEIGRLRGEVARLEEALAETERSRDDAIASLGEELLRHGLKGDRVNP